MIAPSKPDLVTVNIDGQEIAVPKGTNVIEAARLVNVDVPHYCYHPKLTVVGNCRMCLVEMGLPAVDPAVAPILYTIPVQLLAYYTAIAKGTDVDQPRNLAKSVTVE